MVENGDYNWFFPSIYSSPMQHPFLGVESLLAKSWRYGGQQDPLPFLEHWQHEVRPVPRAEQEAGEPGEWLTVWRGWLGRLPKEQTKKCSGGVSGKSSGPGKRVGYGVTVRNSAIACGWTSGAWSEKLCHTPAPISPAPGSPCCGHMPCLPAWWGLLPLAVSLPKTSTRETPSLLKASFQIPAIPGAQANPLLTIAAPHSIHHTWSLFLMLPFIFLEHFPPSPVLLSFLIQSVAYLCSPAKMEACGSRISVGFYLLMYSKHGSGTEHIVGARQTSVKWMKTSHRSGCLLQT